MTYAEADKKRKEVALKFRDGIIKSNPVHDILAFIIAPENSPRNIQEYIFNKCSETQENEERVLFELDTYNSDLNVFIVFKLRGDNIIMKLDSYLSSNLAKEADEGNAS